MNEKNKLIKSMSMTELRKKDSYTLQQEAIELNKASNVSVIELAKRLIVLKQQCLKHNEYMKFIQEKLHMDYNIASKYVRLVRRYGIDESDVNTELVTTLGVKKAIKLLKISDLQERLAFIKQHDLVNKTYKEIEEIVNREYPSETKALNEYSIYTSVYKGLQGNLKVLTDNKTKFKDKKVKEEIKDIENQLQVLISRIEALKNEAEFTEKSETEKAE